MLYLNRLIFTRDSISNALLKILILFAAFFKEHIHDKFVAADLHGLKEETMFFLLL